MLLNMTFVKISSKANFKQALSTIIQGIMMYYYPLEDI